MKSKLGGISTIFLAVGLISYIVFLLGNAKFLFAGFIFPVIGFIVALFAEKGVYRKIGLIGNGMLIFITFIIPFIVTTFFWNKP